MWLMGRLLESLKDYFETTPKEILDNDWKEIEYLNNIGPDVIEYAKFMKDNFGIVVPYSNSKGRVEAHEYGVSVNTKGLLTVKQNAKTIVSQQSVEAGTYTFDTTGKASNGK